tara:strand:- start:30 stop:263 length:234 start_codon:yes stop_codon:yes gene_type:complete
MAFKMRGFSAFTKPTDPVGPNSTTDGDEVSGRTKLEELKNDLLEMNKSIEKHSDKPQIVAKLKISKKKLEVAIAKLQ